MTDLNMLLLWFRKKMSGRLTPSLSFWCNGAVEWKWDQIATRIDFISSASSSPSRKSPLPVFGELFSPKVIDRAEQMRWYSRGWLNWSWFVSSWSRVHNSLSASYSSSISSSISNLISRGNIGVIEKGGTVQLPLGLGNYRKATSSCRILCGRRMR